MIPMQNSNQYVAGFARRSMVALVLIGLACGNVGCGLPVQWQKLANKLPEATPEDPVYYILCIWQPSEGQGPDGQHTRGFAGQISFFTRRQETPVRAKGDVRVYVYDDQGKPEDRGKPLHQWDFVGDAWDIHLHDGTLGPTYSVFIPYTRKGSHQAQCALRVRFTPENGHPIYSETAAVILPGPLRKKEDKPLGDKPKAKKRTSLESLTIPLKEKQEAWFADNPLGQSKMDRIVAPASELARRAARKGVNLPPKTSQAVDEKPQTAKEPALQTLPSPPPQTLPTPVMPAKPLREEPSSPSKPLAEPTITPPPSRQQPHPLGGGSAEQSAQPGT